MSEKVSNRGDGGVKSKAGGDSRMQRGGNRGARRPSGPNGRPGKARDSGPQPEEAERLAARLTHLEIAMTALAYERDAEQKAAIAAVERLDQIAGEKARVEDERTAAEEASAELQAEVEAGARRAAELEDQVAKLKAEALESEAKSIRAELRAEELETSLNSLRSGRVYRLMRVTWRLRRLFKLGA